MNRIEKNRREAMDDEPGFGGQELDRVVAARASLKKGETFLPRLTRGSCWVLSLMVLLCVAAPADGPDISVQLDTAGAGPRKIEMQTESRLLADYRVAWADIALALNSNDTSPLQGVFIGTAKEWLEQTVASQRQSRVTTRYSNQSHRLRAVFYAQEGDLVVLHDTAEYERQVLADGKVVLQDGGTHHWVVVMTPGADRWMVRQLMEVPQF